jgi:hypothetical protein
MLRCGKGEYNRSNSRTNTCEKSRFSWKGCSKTFHCEFFQKSKVAVSELAGSVEENLRYLLDKNGKLINEKKLKHFIESIQPLLESLKPLEKGSGIKIEERHIVQMLKYFLKMTMIH